MKLSSPTFIVFSSLFTAQVITDSINPPGCGIAKPLGRVISGKKVGRMRMPWIVHVLVTFRFSPKDTRLMGCGGTILSHRFILTAAHCVRYRSQRACSIEVKYNTTHSLGGPTVEVMDVIPHPRFNPNTIENDIALLKLSEPLRFDKFVKPVCLPMRRLQLIKRRAFVAGWGRTNEQGKWDRSLRYIQTRILPYKKCTRSFDSWESQDAFSRKNVICTKTGGKGACWGDSGGPVTIWQKKRHRYLQVGIVSFSKGCSEKGHPNVHTRVSFYVPWIRQMLWFRWWI